jgi:hypothetical protein
MIGIQNRNSARFSSTLAKMKAQLPRLFAVLAQAPSSNGRMQASCPPTTAQQRSQALSIAATRPSTKSLGFLRSDGLDRIIGIRQTHIVQCLAKHQAELKHYLS